MWLATLQIELELQKYNHIKISFGEVYRRIFVQKSRFTAQLAHCSKTKFPMVYRTKKILNTVISNCTHMSTCTLRLIEVHFNYRMVMD